MRKIAWRFFIRLQPLRRRDPAGRGRGASARGAVGGVEGAEAVTRDDAPHTAAPAGAAAEVGAERAHRAGEVGEAPLAGRAAAAADSAVAARRVAMQLLAEVDLAEAEQALDQVATVAAQRGALWAPPRSPHRGVVGSNPLHRMHSGTPPAAHNTCCGEGAGAPTTTN